MNVEPAVRIYYPDDVPLIEMPSAEQLHQLAQIVLQKYPELGPDLRNPRWADMNAAEFDQGFRASFRRIASLRRTDTFDIKPTIQRHTNEAMDWFAGQKMPCDIRWPQYVCAAVAAGDISFSLEPPLVGLKLDGVGRAPVAAWKDILQGRALRAVTPPPR